LVLNKVHGNNNDWVYKRLGGHLDVSGYLSVYAAYVDNRPASIAWTYFQKGKFASLFAGITLPEHRKRGLYTSLLSMRLKEIGIIFNILSNYCLHCKKVIAPKAREGRYTCPPTRSASGTVVAGGAREKK
jgi:hypothetical protein